MRTILSLFCLLLIACGGPESTDQESKKDNIQEVLVGEEALKIEEKSFFDDQLRMLLPSSFEEMDNDVLLAKYHKSNLPTMVFTNKENSINCVINFTENPSSLDKLTEYESIFSRRLAGNGVTMYKSQIDQINGRDFLVLQFDTPGGDINIYNHMVVGVLDDRLFMATFNCWGTEKEEWEAIGNKIINSIKFPKEA